MRPPASVLIIDGNKFKGAAPSAAAGSAAAGSGADSSAPYEWIPMGDAPATEAAPTQGRSKSIIGALKEMVLR